MSVTIKIKGTPIEFPSTGESPNWAPAIIEFAQATEDAFLASIGPYDIPQKVFILQNEINTNTEVQGLSFSTAVVRAAFIKYAVIRIGSLTTLSESGNMMAVYDENSGWSVLSRDYIGDAECTFDITPSGQVRISTGTLTGYSTDSKMSFSAQALVQNLSL